MTPEQEIFIECYLFKKMKFKEIEKELKKIDSSKQYSDVQRLNKECKDEIIRIQNIRKKFTKKRQEDNNNDFEAFYQWYEIETSLNSCGYCGVSQEELYILFNKENRTLPLNNAIKRSSGTLEIERKDSKNNSYHISNLILACPLCNNAKSNLIDEQSWKELFVQPMRDYYEKLLGKQLQFAIPQTNTKES